jgi:hypothetical protein
MKLVVAGFSEIVVTTYEITRCFSFNFVSRFLRNTYLSEILVATYGPRRVMTWRMGHQVSPEHWPLINRMLPLPAEHGLNSRLASHLSHVPTQWRLGGLVNLYSDWLPPPASWYSLWLPRHNHILVYVPESLHGAATSTAEVCQEACTSATPDITMSSPNGGNDFKNFSERMCEDSAVLLHLCVVIAVSISRL